MSATPSAEPAGGGRRTLVMVADDNFSPQQVTQVLAFEVAP